MNAITKLYRINVVIAVFLAAITLVLTAPSICFATNQDDDSPNALVVDKYLTKNDDGTYRLSLEVTSEMESKGKTAGADIVAIIDVSSSMSYAFDGSADDSKERFNAAMNAGRTLANQVLGKNKDVKDPLKNRIAIVTFSGDAEIKQKFSDSLVGTLGTIDLIETSSGTNWGAGIDKGLNLLESSKQERPNAHRHVIFVTDGRPTSPKVDNPKQDCDRDDLGEYLPKGDVYKHYDSYLVGVRGESYDRILIARRVDYCVEQITENKDSFDHCFSVICGKTTGRIVLDTLHKQIGEKTKGDSSTEEGDSKPIRPETSATEKVISEKYAPEERSSDCSPSKTSTIGKSTYIDGTEKTDFENAFNELIAGINHKQSFVNVEVTDVLSEWADMKLEDGNPRNLTFEKVVGETVTPVEDFDGRFEYKETSKKITWRPVPEGDVLEAGATYRVSFDIVPTQKAFDTAAECKRNGEDFPDEGINSAGQVANGFFSNARDDNGDTKAKVTYQKEKLVMINDEISKTTTGPYTKPFPKPVMDVPVSTLTVEKVWSDGDAKHENETVSYVVNQDKNILFSGELMKDSWTQQHYVSAGPEGHTYTIEENSTGKDYVVSVSTDNGSSYISGNSVDIHPQGLKAMNLSVKFKNTTRDGAYGLKVHKYSHGETNVSLPGAEFSLYKDVGSDKSFDEADKQEMVSVLTTNNSGEIYFEKLDHGSYWLVETKAPSGYNIMEGPILINIVPKAKKIQAEFTATRYVDGSQIESPATMKTVNNERLVGKISVANKEIASIPVCGKNPITELATIGLGLMISAICISMGAGLRKRRVL